jgi:hypothetical protein
LRPDSDDGTAAEPVYENGWPQPPNITDPYRAQLKHWIDKGFVVLKGAVPLG